MSDNKSPQMKIELIDTKIVFQNLKDLTSLLNKACKNGSFDLEESNTIYNIMGNLTKVSLSLDSLQKLVLENAKETREREIQLKKDLTQKST